ncbi:hypothetical protein V5799_010118 [Amblyomma americanum]|uniref:Uncharacterized protein n=1 Tax=Amblyomma americanum TaxID=6943 RepID=A0AAQ4FA21_AMBAM
MQRGFNVPATTELCPITAHPLINCLRFNATHFWRHARWFRSREQPLSEPGRVAYGVPPQVRFEHVLHLKFCFARSGALRPTSWPRTFLFLDSLVHKTCALRSIKCDGFRVAARRNGP